MSGEQNRRWDGCSAQGQSQLWSSSQQFNQLKWVLPRKESAFSEAGKSSLDDSLFLVILCAMTSHVYSRKKERLLPVIRDGTLVVYIGAGSEIRRRLTGRGGLMLSRESSTPPQKLHLLPFRLPRAGLTSGCSHLVPPFLVK
jgi:hypothetical protein